MKNIALVEEEEIVFGDGLNILTGETGAGKSIVIGGICAAVGAASLRDYCPREEESSMVELIFDTEDPKVRELLAGRGIECEDGQIILSRKYQNGRTINRVNGETVPVSVLKETASLLIDIHGQNQHHSLLRPAAHRQLLDRFCAQQLGDLPQRCANEYRAWQEAEEERRAAVMDEAARLKQIDLLRYEIDEIDNACLRTGEDEELEEQYRRMNNGQKIMEALAETAALTGGEEGASAMISRAVRSLMSVSSYDPKAGELLDQLMELESLASDFDRNISGYMDDFSYDEETFRLTEERLDTINRLKLKYGNRIEDILKECERSKVQLEQLENHEQYLRSLEKRSEEAKARLSKCAEEISAIRHKYAVSLQEKISAALKDLNFLDTRFLIGLSRLPAVTSAGYDEVNFMISLNPGMPVRPLQDVASGGELSRIMLAVKSVMADQDEIETLIFDEIDTGISGRTAQKVSEKMAVIAKKHQVICITHLAQIAAMADMHFVIEKKASDGKTRTFVRMLSGSETTDELARILGGASITETVLSSAAEMKQQADRIKEKLQI